MKPVTTLFALLFLVTPLAAFEITCTDPMFTLRLSDAFGLKVTQEDQTGYELETQQGANGTNAGPLLQVSISKQSSEMERSLPMSGATLVMWKGHSLYMQRRRSLEMRDSRGAPVEIWTVHKWVEIPLRGRSIRVSVTGFESVEAQVDNTMAAILSGIDGPSNWELGAGRKPAAGGSSAEASGSDALLVTLGPALIILLIVLGVIYEVFNRGAKRKAQPQGVQPWPPYQQGGPLHSPPLPQAPAPGAAPQAPAAAQLPVRSCRYCGAPLRDGRKKCMGCGAEAG